MSVLIWNWELEHPSLIAFGHQNSKFLAFRLLYLTPVALRSQALVSNRVNTISCPGPQTTGLKLNHTTSFLLLQLADYISWDLLTSVIT
jgi:hypothetical protein